MTDLSNRYAAVGAAIRRDRDADESQAAFCQRIRVSTTKLRELEQGRPGNYRERTLIRISDGIWGRRDVLARVLAGEEVDDVLASPPPPDPADRRDGDRSDADPSVGTRPTGDLSDQDHPVDAAAPAEVVRRAARAAAALDDVLDLVREATAALLPSADEEPRAADDGDEVGAAGDVGDAAARLHAVLADVHDAIPLLVDVVRAAADQLEALHRRDRGAVDAATRADATSLATSLTSLTEALGLPPDLALAADGRADAVRGSLAPTRRRARPDGET